MDKKTWRNALLFCALAPWPLKAEIRGLYGTNCLEGHGVSAIKDLLFREQTMETVQTIYSDAHCEVPAYDFSFSGPYDLDTLSRFLNYAYTSIKLGALSEETVAKFNQEALCGITDWQINQAREVSGLNCGGQIIPEKGTRAFDIIRERATDDSVQLGLIGETTDGLSPEKRPKEFEELSYYPK